MCFSGPECPKIDVGWGFAQSPLGSLQRSPGPLAGFRRKGPGKRTGKGWEREGKMGRREEGGTGDLLHGLRGIDAPGQYSC